MKDIMGLMKQAKAMQAKMEEAKAKVADLVAEGVSGGGMVRVTLSGEGHMKSLNIDPSMIVADEAEILEDLIIAAYHDAKVKLDQKQAETMQAAMGDLKLPPGMELPF
ncbi:MAG TPA: YbaB/EbfC family nucleoid-associated protein [Hellea balneolensis]|uniref:Nucleoid-associated protein ENK01_00645 n=1 Tax=Hellea balneolensis TaxID=287478 RepID=A0A7V5U0V7_9PROT|nr:YbaB/EbfC family nucleoid-associated protein [Hellea balneolensis]